MGFLLVQELWENCMRPRRGSKRSYQLWISEIDRNMKQRLASVEPRVHSLDFTEDPRLEPVSHVRVVRVVEQQRRKV